MQISAPHERLAQARGQLGLTLREFAAPLGTTYASVHDWENGHTKKITKAHALTIEQAHGISAEWLLNGIGCMFVKKTENSDLMVPVLSITSNGSINRHGGGVSFDERWLHEAFGVPPKNLCLFRVSGDSMVPTINPNDWVFIDSAPAAGLCNGIWALRIGPILDVRRIQALGSGFEAKSDNSTYAPIPIEDTSQIMGRVVGLPRRL